MRGMLFPIFGFGERKSDIRANFDRNIFVYNIASHDWTTKKLANTIRFCNIK